MAAHDILLSNFVSFFHINNCSNTLNISDFDHIIISLFFSNKELSELNLAVKKTIIILNT